MHTRLWATAENRRRVAGYRSMYADDAPGWIAARQALKCDGRALPRRAASRSWWPSSRSSATRSTTRYPFPEVHAKVARGRRGAGARVVDLLPAYRGLRWELLVVDGADDEHPNEIAHRIAANVILQRARRRGARPPAAPPGRRRRR